MPTVIYRRDPKKKYGEWTSTDGRWTGATWESVHKQLKKWAADNGCEEVHDTPVYPWLRIFWPLGTMTVPSKSETTTTRNTTGVVPPPSPTRNTPSPDPVMFSLFDE